MVSRRVLVVGGGIAGFGLARALSDRGIGCTVAESWPAPRSAGFALNLPGNAARALAALGLDHEVHAAGWPITRREYRSQSGRLLFSVDEGAVWAGVGRSVCVRRDTLLDLLRAGVDPGTVRWGSRVAAVVPDGEVVKVRASAGTEETEEEYDYVVGADGVHSSVRAAVAGGGRLQPAAMGATSWRFEAPNPGVTCWTAWTGREGTVLLIPLDDHHVYGYASTTRGGAAGSDPSWLTGTFDAFPDPVAATVASAVTRGDQLHHSRVEEVHAERWSVGRTTLIGDAAHAMGPVWAQGAALALEDALVLAELLATRRDWSGVGAAFEQRRRPRVAHVAAETDRMSRIARLPLWLRDLVAPVAGPRAHRSAYEPLREPLG